MSEGLVCVGGPADGRRVNVRIWQKRVVVPYMVPGPEAPETEPREMRSAVYRKVGVRCPEGEVEFLVPMGSGENPFTLLLEKYPRKP